MPSRYQVCHGLLIFFMCLAWLLALGGLSGLADLCNDSLQNGGCANAFRFSWWLIFFTFFLWICVESFMVTHLIHEYRMAIMALLALNASECMEAGEQYLFSWKQQGDGADGQLVARLSAAAGGFIFITLIDVALIIVIGSEEHSAVGKRIPLMPVGTTTTLGRIRRRENRPSNTQQSTPKAAMSPNAHSVQAEQV